MKFKAFLLPLGALLCLLFSSCATLRQSEENVTQVAGKEYQGNGYSIQYLRALKDREIEVKENSSEADVIMNMRSTGNGKVVCSVNVSIQPFYGSVAGYLAVSKREFKADGSKFLSAQKINSNTLAIESIMKGNGLEYYVFSYAILSDGKAYLATAGCPLVLRFLYEEVLKESATSLRLQPS